MTQDFRQPSPTRIQSGPANRATGLGRPVQARAKPTEVPSRFVRRVVLTAIYGVSLLLFAAGVGLLTVEQEFIPAENAPLVGMTFILMSLADVAAILFLQALWTKPAERRK